MSELQIVRRCEGRVPQRFLAEKYKILIRELSNIDFGKKSLKKRQSAYLVMVFLDEREARKLNRQYRGRNYATDILSFSDVGGLGELVLCLPVIVRQARDNRWSVRWEIAYMMTHGVLHLLGLDHERGPREAARMFKLQDQLFNRLQPPHPV